MSLNHSPSVVTNGLVMYYDMNNTKKSWNGQPTINQFSIPTPGANGYVTFPVQGTAGFQRIYSGTYGGYEIQPTDVVYKYVLGLAPTGCHYHGNTITVTSGQVATWSFDYYIDPSTTGYPVTNYLANIESTVGVSTSLADPTPAIIGAWKRATRTSTAATANGTFNAYLYPGACGSQLATGGFILYKNPQVDLNAFATPFVAGTRANTQAIVDLTGKNTLTATSLTYAADNTFSFNGAIDYISMPWVNYNFFNGVSYSVWMKTASADAVVDYAGNAAQSIISDTTGAVDTGFGVHGGKVRYTHYNTTWYTATGNITVNTNTYHHIVATHNKTGTYVIYVDGVQDVTGSIPLLTLGINCIGRGYGGDYFTGSIGVVQIYNKALSAAEVNQNFNALRGRYGI